jgi:hypothetical protein
MESILFIHDNSPRSKKGLEFAASLAARLNARILLAHTQVPQIAERVKVFAGNTNGLPPTPADRLPEPESAPDEINISALDARELAHLVNKEGIGMIIKCVAEDQMPVQLNLDTLLNHIHCPLLLIPGNWTMNRATGQ